MQPELKRGYMKWTDENGVRHKVKLEEYKAVEEIVEEAPAEEELETTPEVYSELR